MSAPLSPGAAAEGPGNEAVAEFARLAPEHRIRAALEALGRNGITTHFVDTDGEARDVVRSILPPGAEVYNNTSRTLELIGVAEDIERSGRYSFTQDADRRISRCDCRWQLHSG
jgi:hypothetical protein